MNSSLKENDFSENSHPAFAEVKKTIIEKKPNLLKINISNSDAFDAHFYTLNSIKDEVDSSLKVHTKNEPAFLGINVFPNKDSIFCITILTPIDNNEISKEYLLNKINIAKKIILKYIKNKYKKQKDKYTINVYTDNEESNPTKERLETLIMNNISSISDVSNISSTDENIFYYIYSAISAHIKKNISFLDIDFLQFPYKLKIGIENDYYKNHIIKSTINGYYCDNHQLIFNLLLSLMFISEKENRLENCILMLNKFNERYISHYYEYTSDFIYFKPVLIKDIYRKKHSMIPSNYKSDSDILSSFISNKITEISNYMTNYFN